MKYILKVKTACGGQQCVCDMDIWYKAWENYVETLKFECTEQKTRRRREVLVGGPTQIDESEFATLEQMVTNALDYASAKNPNNNY